MKLPSWLNIIYNGPPGPFKPVPLPPPIPWDEQVMKALKCLGIIALCYLSGVALLATCAIIL